MKKSGRTKKPFVLVILDGWGYTKEKRGNPFTQAKTPFLDSLFERHPFALLEASGRAVGLPVNQAGNSEAGHLNIGAGRIVEQDAMRISHSINDGTFFKNAALHAAIMHVKKYKSNLHLIGLFTGDQSAHADPDHLLALISLARVSGVKNAYLHLFTDGRDAPKYASVATLRKFSRILPSDYKIGTVMGRYYAMDRIKEWSRTRQAYDALVLGEGLRAGNVEKAIVRGYNRGESDEYLTPTVLRHNSRIFPRIADNDAAIFFNLRSDRVRQLTKAFTQDKKTFAGFARKKILKNFLFVTLTEVGPDLPNILCAFPSVRVEKSLPIVLSGRRQLFISESEKFAHVTYFFNGGYAQPVAGEERIMIKSPSVQSYDQVPQMSGAKLTRTLLKAIQSKMHDFILVNYPNLDMIGHSGNLKAAVKACEYVDSYLKQVVPATNAKGGTIILTADHGNIEQMLYADSDEIETKHSMNPVPFFVISKRFRNVRLKRHGILADVAPTILSLMGIDPPSVMRKTNLCQKS